LRNRAFGCDALVFGARSVQVWFLSVWPVHKRSDYGEVSASHFPRLALKNYLIASNTDWLEQADRVDNSSTFGLVENGQKIGLFPLVIHAL
jgi:hypothetical protein